MNTTERKAIIIIPCRLKSRRLPEKVMMEVDSKPLLHWVYEKAKQTVADSVIVATPNRRIAHYCRDYGFPWFPTAEHPTGTHRCAEVLSHFRGNAGVDVVVNWQCDEPMVEPEDVNALIEMVRTVSDIATLASPLADDDSEWQNSNVTKVVCYGGKACWFSRAAMGGADAHCGVYAFKSSVLRKLGCLSPSRYSKVESLEQLTWLEAGFEIDVLSIRKLPLAINDRADFERFKTAVGRRE